MQRMSAKEVEFVQLELLEKELVQLGIKYVHFHLDALTENFIKSGSQKMFLTDWEYSDNYDKLWDTTSIILESNYSKDEEALLLEYYFDRTPSDTKK